MCYDFPCSIMKFSYLFGRVHPCISFCVKITAIIPQESLIVENEALKA